MYMALKLSLHFTSIKLCPTLGANVEVPIMFFFYVSRYTVNVTLVPTTSVALYSVTLRAILQQKLTDRSDVNCTYFVCHNQHFGGA